MRSFGDFFVVTTSTSYWANRLVAIDIEQGGGATANDKYHGWIFYSEKQSIFTESLSNVIYAIVLISSHHSFK